MPPLVLGYDEYVRRRVDTILSQAENAEVRTAMDELFRHLSENPRAPEPCSARVQWAVAIDSDNDVIVEIVSRMLPTEWSSRATVAAYDQFTDVIRMARDTLPSLLVIHSNLLLTGVGEALAGCVAVSPSTRYLIMTAWSAEVMEQLRRVYEPLNISIDTLYMPFDREQLKAALSSASSDVHASKS